MFGLQTVELLLVALVALLLFGGNLPKVAAEAASWFVRLRRSLGELRRESGIDREIESARRMLEDSVPSDVRSFDVRRAAEETLARPLREAARELEAPAQPTRTDEPPAQAPPERTVPPRSDRGEDTAG